MRIDRINEEWDANYIDVLQKDIRSRCDALRYIGSEMYELNLVLKRETLTPEDVVFLKSFAERITNKLKEQKFYPNYDY